MRPCHSQSTAFYLSAAGRAPVLAITLPPSVEGLSSELYRRVSKLPFLRISPARRPLLHLVFTRGPGRLRVKEDGGTIWITLPLILVLPDSHASDTGLIASGENLRNFLTRYRGFSERTP